MLIRELKYEFKNKKLLILLILSFLLFVFAFLTIKSQFYYYVFNYIPRYLFYYVTEYLQGDASNLIVNNVPLIYIESDLSNIASSLYLYVATFGTTIISIFNYVFPLIIFSRIAKNLYSEINNNFTICKITRIGKKKYFNNLIIKNGIVAGMIFVIPRILYFLILTIFFPNGSSIHVLSDAPFITNGFLYNTYNINPYLLISVDFIITFLYGFFLSSLSIAIISLIKNKPLTYLIFIFTMGALSLVCVVLKIVPIIFYNFIYTYAYNNQADFSLYIPLIIISILNLILYILTKYIYQRGVMARI